MIYTIQYNMNKPWNIMPREVSEKDHILFDFIHDMSRIDTLVETENKWRFPAAWGKGIGCDCWQVWFAFCDKNILELDSCDGCPILTIN